MEDCPISQTLRVSPAEPGDFLLSINFQVNHIGNRTHFLTRGEAIPGTNYRLANFAFKKLLNSTDTPIDISELEIVHARTGRKVILVFREIVDIPAPDEPAPLPK